MSDFQTTSEVIVTPNERSLRDLRDRVEDVGPISVDLAPTTRNPAARGAGRPDGGRGLGRQVKQTTSVLKEIRDLQSDTLIQLEDLSDDLGGGGPGGGGGATEILAGIVGDVGGEAAGAAAETVGSVGGTAAGSALGTLAGEVIASQLAGGGGGDGGGGGGTVTLEDDTVSIDDGETPLPVEDVSLTVDKPDWVPIPVERPEPVPIPVEDVGPIPVEDVGPIPVDVPDRTPVVAPPTPPLRQRDTTTPSTRGPYATDLPTTPRPIGPMSGDGSESGLFESVGAGAVAGATTGGTIGLAGGPQTAAIGVAGGALLGGVGGALGYGLNQVDDQVRLQRGRGSSASGTGQRSGAGTTDVNVDVRRDTTIRVDPNGLQSLKRDIIDEVERAHDKDIRELEREIERLKRGLAGGTR